MEHGAWRFRREKRERRERAISLQEAAFLEPRSYRASEPKKSEIRDQRSEVGRQMTDDSSSRFQVPSSKLGKVMG